MSTNAWCIWAPKAQRVEVELAESHARLEAKRGADGTFTLPREQITEPYFVRLDGGEPMPDPRAQRLDDVHGPGRLVELEPPTEAFSARPLEDAVIYELHIGTFTEGGTFATAIEKLPYLVELGVTHVELMPVATWSGQRNWGYDGAGLFAPAESYGGPAALRELVKAAHEQGLAVLLDVVYNHLGPIGNYLGALGPYFRADRHTPWGDALNFDGEGSDEVRRFFLDNALQWLRDYGIDGLRLDAVHAIADSSAYPFLAELSEEVELLSEVMGKPLQLIAESDLNDPRVIRSRDRGGLGMDAQWCDDFHHALHVALTGETTGYYHDFAIPAGQSPWSRVAKALTDGYVYAGERAPHRGRRHGAPLDADMSLGKLVGYAQTHDQIGNRAQGERLSHLVSVERARIAAALVLTGPFVPMLFAGEEWGASTPFQFFTDHREPEVAEATRQGRRNEFKAFGWNPEQVPDPQAHETYRRSRLKWGELAEGAHAELLAWHRALIRLRQQNPALRDGSRSSITAEARSELLVVRRGAFTIVANLGPPTKADLAGELVLHGTPETTLDGRTLVIAHDDVAIVRTA